MSKKHDKVTKNALAFLRQRKHEGAGTRVIAMSIGLSGLSHIGRALKMGREAGIIVARQAPGGRCTNRLMYYLPEYAPDQQATTGLTAPTNAERLIAYRPHGNQHLSQVTLRALEMARRPGGVDTAELAADLGIKSGNAAGRLQSAYKLGGLFCGERGSRLRYFGTEQEAAEWGKVRKQGVKLPAMQFNTSIQPSSRASKGKTASGPADMSHAKITKAPKPVDKRFEVKLARTYKTCLDPNDCRPYARVVAP